MILDLLLQLRPVITDAKLIRLGPNQDGGYLLANRLGGITTCFSSGGSRSSDFVSALQQKHNIGSHLADGSVDGPAGEFFPLSFLKKHVSDHDDDKNISVDTWVNQSADAKDNNLILQMDVDGNEYRVIEGMSEQTLNRFRIIIIELHDLTHWIQHPEAGEKFLSKLTKNHYVTSLSPNNIGRFAELEFSLNEFGPGKMGTLLMPDMAQISLIRSDCVIPSGVQTEWPHPLDFPNDPNAPGIPLPNGWPGRLTIKV
jgi:hypothetical protein